MPLTRASIKQRVRTFALGVAVLLLGVIGAYLVFQNRWILGVGMSPVPPGVVLILPGCVMLMIGGIMVITRSCTPKTWESRLCYLCGKTTKHFRADPRFRQGRKIGDTYVCDRCGQKYLVTKPLLHTSRSKMRRFGDERRKHDAITP